MHWSEEQYADYLKKNNKKPEKIAKRETPIKELPFDFQQAEKKSKYRNKKTVVDGIEFDSKKEADYYIELKIMQRAGKIIGIDLQPVFVLQEGFTYQGKKYQPITYVADFRVYYIDSTMEIIDTKGFKTKDYQIKKKLFLYKYPDIRFKEV